jgi:GTP cyclohydrolase IA
MSIRVMNSEENAEYHAKLLLSGLEAWDRVDENHRADTPKRMVKALTQLTTREPFNFTTFPNEGSSKVDEMITLGPIPFYTLCAHHVVPFFGNAWVSYVPDEKIAGLSKFARAVRWSAKGLWVQEALTQEIANMLETELKPHGVAVVLKAEHMCMAMRGVQVPGVITTTSAMKGVYADHQRTAKAEFLESIKVS